MLALIKKTYTVDKNMRTNIEIKISSLFVHTIWNESIFDMNRTKK